MFENISPDLGQTTKHGMDKLDVMVKFISVIESKGKRALDSNFNKLKSFLVEKLQRGLTKDEEINMMEGICNFIKTDPETNERLTAMKYLFELEFIIDKTE